MMGCGSGMDKILIMARWGRVCGVLKVLLRVYSLHDALAGWWSSSESAESPPSADVTRMGREVPPPDQPI
ncbi:unnamed protein product [Arctogadus glacialis]